MSEEEQQDYIDSLKSRGLSRQEAETYVENEQMVRDYVIKNKESAFIIKTPCTLISYGVK